MKFETSGLVLTQMSVGEADRLISILTKDMGIIRAFVKGAKKLSSNVASSTQVFCYSNFSIYETKNKFIVNSAIPVEIFFNLYKSIDKLALAQYLCELLLTLAPVNENAEDFLKLGLNSLYLLANKKKNLYLIKSVFELKIMALSGYMPDLTCCAVCGKYRLKQPLFSLGESKLFCSNCSNGILDALSISQGILDAMRHILYSDANKMFNFNLSDTSLKALSEITEQYLKYTVQKDFRSLKFLHSMYVQ